MRKFEAKKQSSFARLAEDYLDELAQDYRIRRAYQLEALKREKRGMRRGESINPSSFYKGNDPLWNAEW